MFKSLLAFTALIGLVFGELPINVAVTTNAPTTTTAANVAPILNFSIINPENNQTCLLLQFAINMDITYEAYDEKNNTVNRTDTLAIPSDYNNATGVCDTNSNKFKLVFWNEWVLDIEYTLVGDKYSLTSMILNYNINTNWFPNATRNLTLTANAGSLSEFPSTKGSSYRCNSKTTVVLDSMVKFEISHYQGEPFYSNSQTNKDAKFHTAIDCPADQTGTSKLVPIIVGSALAFLVVLVLIAYLIGRQRHRTGYQSV